MSYETRILILTGIVYLLKEPWIDLTLDIPITHYSKYKDEFADIFKGQQFRVSLYDYKKGEYNKNNIAIRRVDVKPQGFFSLMSALLNTKGDIAPGQKKTAAGLNVAVDIGYYSTDIYSCNELKPLAYVPEKPLPGMIHAYRIIKSKLYDRFGLRKEPYEIEDYIINKEVRVSGEVYDITELIDFAFEQLTRNIISRIRNLIPFYSSVDNWFLAGGGGIALEEDFKTHFNNLTLIDNAQFSNATGGLKWARRIWK